MKRLLSIAFLIASCGGTTGSGAVTPAAIATAAPSPVYDYLEDVPIGQCLDPIRDKDDDVILAASLKSCDETHLAEVVGRRQLPYTSEAPFPGDSPLARASETECRAAFSDYVGIDYDESSLDVEYQYPGPLSWPGGDRIVTCMVVGSGVTALTRSVKGSRE